MKAAIIVHCVTVWDVCFSFKGFSSLSTLSWKTFDYWGQMIYAIKCLLGSWHHGRSKTVVQSLQFKHNVQMLPFFSPRKREVFIYRVNLCALKFCFLKEIKAFFLSFCVFHPVHQYFYITTATANTDLTDFLASTTTTLKQKWEKQPCLIIDPD